LSLGKAPFQGILERRQIWIELDNPFFNHVSILTSFGCCLRLPVPSVGISSPATWLPLASVLDDFSAMGSMFYQIELREDLEKEVKDAIETISI
jgi:hypothetical protein